jgi:hypothetical protein
MEKTIAAAFVVWLSATLSQVGVLGHSHDLERIRRIADDELEGTSAQVWDWTRIKPHIFPNPVAHIMQYERNCFRAKRLAEQITCFRREHPDVKLSIVALSGGAPISVFSLEALPADVAIERLVLLSGAISPGYDLTKALAHVNQEVINYHSRRDWLILKWGTKMFGTGDRVRSQACGYSGFDTRRACPSGCDDLVQIEWHTGLRKFGNRGGHIGSVAREFIDECAVEWLRGNVQACVK